MVIKPRDIANLYEISKPYVKEGIEKISQLSLQDLLDRGIVKNLVTLLT